MGKDLNQVDNIVFICNGSTCLTKGADENTHLMRAVIKENNLHDKVHTIRTKCCGQCEEGPIVFIHPDGTWYKKVNALVAAEIVTTHLMLKKALPAHVLFQKNNV